MTRTIISHVIVVGLLLRAGEVSAFAQADPHAGHAPPPAPAAAQGERPKDLPPFIPAVTDEDRKAAFPDVEGHAVHDQAVNYFVLLDQFEWRKNAGLSVDSRGWVGRDRDRLWFRAEGEGDGGSVGEAHADFLYGRHLAVVGSGRGHPPGLPAR